MNLEARGLIRAPSSAGRARALINEAAMTVGGQVDDVLRELAARRLAEFRPELGRALVGDAIDALLARVEPAAVARKLHAAERDGADRISGETYGDRLAVHVLADDVARLLDDAATRLIELGVLRDRPDLLTPQPGCSSGLPTSPAICSASPGRRSFSRIADQLSRSARRRLKEKVKSLNWELFDRAVGATNLAAIEELIEARAASAKLDRRAEPRSPDRELQGSAPRSTSRSPIGCCSGGKRRPTLRDEMSTALQMPGWGNSSLSRSPTGSRCCRPACGCRSR